MISKMYFTLLLLLHCILTFFFTQTTGHHEPQCPDGTNPISIDTIGIGSQKFCTCKSTHENGMEVTCSNKKGDNLRQALSVYKSGNEDLPINSLVLQLNFIPTVENDTFNGLKVKELQFRLNRIKNFSENAFHGIEDSLEKLTILEFFWVSFKYKTLDQIPVQALKPLKNLKELFISSANIRSIPPNAFDRLSKLEVLKIMSFTLNKMNNDSLNGLSNLRDFSLVTNFLKDIPPLTFSQTPNIEKIFMSLKSLKKLQKTHFSNLRYLRELYLNNSGIDSIEPDSLDASSNTLKVLSLKGNQISDISSSISNLPKLTHLDISSNTIIEIRENSFSGLNSLEHLFASYNIIKHIKANVLGDSIWLKHIDLKANLLTQIPENFFQTFKNLEFLDLSKNFIGEIPELAFDQNVKLTKLDLSNNNLKTVYPSSFKSLGNKLIFLDLSHNYLNNISYQTLSEFQNLQYFNISHNNLTGFDINALQGSEDTLKFIGMSNNPWHCDCKMRRFREWYKFWVDQMSHADKYVQEKDMEQAKCASPPNLAGVPILYPPLNAFVCSQNGSVVNSAYHVKGTNDLFDANKENSEFNPESNAVNSNDATRGREPRVDMLKSSSDIAVMNSLGTVKALRSMQKLVTLSLTLSILTIGTILAVFLAKFLLTPSSGFKGSTSPQFPHHYPNDNFVNPLTLPGENASNENGGKYGKFGNFLTSIPVPLKNGHVNVPEDKQSIANNGFPMGTVA